MSIPGVAQGTLHAKRREIPKEKPSWSIQSALGFGEEPKRQPEHIDWSIPIWLQPDPSQVFRSNFPIDLYGPCALHVRIANSLGIKIGDMLDITIAGNDYTMPVSLIDSDEYDCVIDVQYAGMGYQSYRVEDDETILTLRNDKSCTIQHQELYKPIQLSSTMGGVALEFTAVSQNGYTGFGFCLHSSIDSENCVLINDLVRGFRYCGKFSKEEATYAALVEGLIWASRLHAQRVFIVADSDFILGQIMGTSGVDEEAPILPYYQRATNILSEMKENGTFFSCFKVHENKSAVELARKAIAQKKVTIACNWNSINKQLQRYVIDEDRAPPKRISASTPTFAL